MVTYCVKMPKIALYDPLYYVPPEVVFVRAIWNPRSANLVFGFPWSIYFLNFMLFVDTDPFYLYELYLSHLILSSYL